MRVYVRYQLNKSLLPVTNHTKRFTFFYLYDSSIVQADVEFKPIRNSLINPLIIYNKERPVIECKTSTLRKVDETSNK